MTTYGVNPEGLVVKPTSVILQSIEAKLIAKFGPNIIQTAQSPLGQLNGMVADLAAESWEVLQDAYNALDVDVAEGAQLDSLGKLRLVYRMEGESDIDYRRAISNAEQGRIDTQDVLRAVLNVEGTTWAHVSVNEGDFYNALGQPPGSITIAALGGEDEDVAAAVRAYAVPGVIQYGNTPVGITVDGFCRTITIMRPTVVPTTFSITVVRRNDPTGCPPPAPSTVSAGLLASLNSPRPANGQGVTVADVTALLGELYGRTIEVLSTTGLPLEPQFDEILDITSIEVSATT